MAFIASARCRIRRTAASVCVGICAVLLLSAGSMSGTATAVAVTRASTVAAASVVGQVETPAGLPSALLPGQRPGRLRWRHYLAQRIRWGQEACSQDVLDIAAWLQRQGRYVVECAEVLSAMDWDDPGKGSITLLVTRVRRSPAVGDTRHSRLLFVNPGGPGAPAGWLAADLAYLEPKLHARHDIVAVDPRGTGGSTPLSCTFYGDGVSDHRNPSRREIAAQQRASARTVRECAARAPLYLAQITTANTVRDHDLVRALLGFEQADWYAVSAGTRLAAHYARWLPQRTGRVVLDSNGQWNADWYTSYRWQPKGFQRRFEEQFLPWVARHHGRYGLGSTAAQVRATYEELRAAAARGRFPGTSADDVDEYIVPRLYLDHEFELAAESLGSLHEELRTGRRDPARGHPPATVARPGRGTTTKTETSAERTVMSAIACNDTAWGREPNQYVRDGQRLGQAYPLIGHTWVQSECAYWPFRSKAVPEPTGSRVDRILMVQTELDPATPWEGAALAALTDRSARLLTVDDQGNHGAFLGENACVERHVNTFLTTGRLPAEATVCAGLPLPLDRRTHEVGTHRSLDLPVLQQRWVAQQAFGASSLRMAASRRIAGFRH